MSYQNQSGKQEKKLPIPPKPELTDVVQRMKEDGCEFFLDSSLNPTVVIKNDGFQQDWPANSERVHDYITTLYYDLSNGQALKSSSLNLLLSLIREECRIGERRLSQAEEERVNRDPIIQAVVLFVTQRGNFDGRTSTLLPQLTKLMDENNGYGEELPPFLNVFTRRLRRQIPALRGHGVGVVLEHKEEGSCCTLTRLPNFQADGITDGVMTQSSGASPMHGKGLPKADDTDGQIRKEDRQVAIELSDAKGGAE